MLLNKIYKEDIGIIKIYTDECISLFGDIEKKILQLEVNSEDVSLYKDLYIDIDKIYRGSSFFGLSAPVRVIYEMKFILGRVKDLKGDVFTEHFDNILLSMDFLKSYISRLNSNLHEFDISADKPDYFEFSTDSTEENIIDGLELFRKKCESEDGKDEYKQVLDGDNPYDVLAFEGLNGGLAQDVKEQFIYENAEHLDLIENYILMRLDNDKNDRETINEIFRAIHTIKGGAGIYLSTLSSEDPYYDGSKKFLEVVHSFENLLALVRDNQLSFSNNLVDLSFKVVDYLKSYIQFIGLGEGSISNQEGIIDSINAEISNIKINSVKDVTQNEVLEISKPSEKYDVKSEGISDDLKHKGSMAQSIRVRQDKIDAMMNMISELVIAKNSFAHIYDILNRRYHLPEITKEIKQVGDYVNRISDELQNSIMSIRMVEIRTVFQKMPRVVRDIAQNTDKTIELITEGEDTEIDKSVIEHISDPLVHIIRNSADHGIETYEERIRLGKPGKGKITLRAYNKNKNVFIEVEDDGRGIDPEMIKKKAIEKGIISEEDASQMNSNQLINLIFLPGFSTASRVTEVSGRGVGMDIVKSNISNINGNVTVESKTGKGTKMIIKLPLSLAISQGLVVEAEGADYIIPLESIVETVKIKRRRIHQFNGKYFTYLRGTVIGMEWLGKVFLSGERNVEKDELNAVILTNGNENFALVVDRLKNELEFVMKPLEGHLSSVPGISGSTILGNGKVVLIVNTSELIKLAAK